MNCIEERKGMDFGVYLEDRRIIRGITSNISLIIENIPENLRMMQEFNRLKLKDINYF